MSISKFECYKETSRISADLNNYKKVFAGYGKVFFAELNKQIKQMEKEGYILSSIWFHNIQMTIFLLGKSKNKKSFFYQKKWYEEKTANTVIRVADYTRVSKDTTSVITGEFRITFTKI